MCEIFFSVKSIYFSIAVTIVVDARIDDGSEKKFNDLGIICTLSQHHGAVLVVKLRSVHIVSVSMKKIQYFIELLANNVSCIACVIRNFRNEYISWYAKMWCIWVLLVLKEDLSLINSYLLQGTECLELEMCDVDDSGLDSLLCMSECLTSLSLAYNRSITSLHFLAGMSNLSQINLSGIRLRGKKAVGYCYLFYCNVFSWLIWILNWCKSFWMPMFLCKLACNFLHVLSIFDFDTP